MAQPLPLRFELLALAQRVGNLAEDNAGTPAAGILLALNRDMHAAVRAVDRLPMNVELLGKAPELVEAGKRLVVELSQPACPECHSTDVYETEVETREVVDGELVTTPAVAFHCCGCAHMFEKAVA